VGEVIRGALIKVPDHVEIIGLAVASQSGSVVALDGSGRSVGPLITWMDRRSAAIVDSWLATGTGEMIRSISGWNPGTGLGLSTLAWIDGSTGDTTDVGTIWAGADTLVTAFLTDRVTTNPSNAAAMQLVDLSLGSWDPQLCDLAGVRPDQLPVLVESGEIIGPITPRAAAEWGLPAGLVVVAGGHDQTCAAFALEVVEPGRVLLGTGTAWVVTAVAESDTFDSIPARFNVSPHVLPGRITASEYLGGLGAEYESWVLTTYGRTTSEDRNRTQLFALAESDITAGNAHGRAALTIMERSAARVRDSLAHLNNSGTRPTGITLIGGATASSVWPGMIADVTGLPGTIPADNSWPAIGAARLAGLHLGAQ